MINSETIKLGSLSFKEKLEPELNNCVFHITTLSNFDKINQSGYIHWNPGNHNFPQSLYNYCYKNRCVSLFDFRPQPESEQEDLEFNLTDAWNVIYRIFSKEKNAVAMILNPQFYDELKIIPNNLPVNRIWRVECGYLEKLFLEKIYLNLHITP